MVVPRKRNVTILAPI